MEQEQLTSSGLMIGTIACMSPEQAHAKTLDGRSALFRAGSSYCACCDAMKSSISLAR